MWYSNCIGITKNKIGRNSIMCIKAIANFDFEAAKDNFKETLKYLDAGKLLGVAGLALEADPKALVNKVKNKLADEDLKLAVQKKLRLVSDIVGWVPTYIEGLVGAVQGYKA